MTDWPTALWCRFGRPLAFALDPERAHRLALAALASPMGPPLARRLAAAADGRDGTAPDLGITLWGRRFPNPVGLAAGFDKDGVAAAGLLGLGFGFVELGTVTPRPQPGNPTPRLFRLAPDRAIINRMGFNNQGVEALAARLARRRPAGLIGLNVGKNKDTPEAEAAEDYARGIAALAGLADYLVINVSSPNTPGLRALQGREALTILLDRAGRALAAAIPDPARRPPLLLKVAPDLAPADRADIAALACAGAVDGLICTNTTIARPDDLADPHRREAGGLSGRPLIPLARESLAAFYALTGGRVPLIAVGGIDSGREAYARLRAGASLVQVYSGLIYEGPALAARIGDELARCLWADGLTSVAQAIGADAPIPSGRKDRGAGVGVGAGAGDPASPAPAQGGAGA